MKATSIYKGYYLYLLSFSLLCLSGKVLAQPPIAFKNFSNLDGLSHNIIRAIIQDSDGFIWIGTQDGLNRFNSHTFEVFRVIPGDSNSLSSNKIMALEEGKYQNIWVGTWGGGICLYNKKTHTFKRLPSPELKRGNRQFSPDFIRDLYLDSKQRMWIGTMGAGLMLADQDHHTFKHYLHDPSNPNSLSNNTVTSITEDQQGKLWIGTAGGGINHFDPETGQFTRYLHHEDDPQSLSNNVVYKVFYDSQQRLWVGTYNYGLNLMTEQPGQFIHFRSQLDVEGNIGNDQIWAIEETPDRKIWIGTDNGIALYNEENRSFSVYRHDPFDPKSLAANPIKDLYTDQQGRMWVGTYNGGVSLFDKGLVQFQHYYATFDRTSLSSNDVSAFLQGSSGKIIICTDGGGLNIFDKENAQFNYFRHDPYNLNSIASDKILTIFRDSKQRIWIGFWNGGLDYFDQENQQFIHVGRHVEHPNGPGSNNITCMSEDQDGMIWLGTFEGGVNRFNPEKKTFEYYRKYLNDPTSISDNQIWSILADQENNIWIGTSSGTLNLFDRQTESFEHINIKEPGESNHTIQVIFEDSKGQLWIGLEGGGLKRFNKDDRTFQTFTIEDGLPSNSINAIEEDQKGYLWISTNQGITRFDPATGNCKNFGTSDGLQGLYFNRASSLQLSSGEILFGGINGFNIFHPDSLQDYTHEIPIVLTNFQIFNRPVPIGTQGSPLQSHINETESIKLSYEHSVFSIEYAALHFTAPEKNKYQYRLKGFVDESWQEVGGERKVTYTNLQPSTYQFEVALADPSIEHPVRTLSITVIPPWWQTWWARLLAGLFLVVSLVSAYKLRLRSIEAQNKRLEKEVAERTASLKKANNVLREMNKLVQEQKEEIQAQAEELEESNEEIRSINQKLEEMVEVRTSDLKKSNKELDNFVYRVSHDIRAPLSSVLGLVELMELEKDPDTLKEYLKMAAKSINKLDGFVKDILDYSRNSRLEIESVEINFSDLLDNTLEELRYMEKAGRLKIIRDFQLNGPYYNDPRRLYIIFRNLFSNAIKYQNPHIPNPYVKVQIRSKEEGVVMIIEDNGIGIASKESARVFDMFYRGSDLSNGSGIGLYIVKETVEKLGGHVSLKTELGRGTVFTIELPNIRPG